jgi:protein-S-isoprenylcysteine O-methyltransferase Ste14
MAKTWRDYFFVGVQGLLFAAYLLPIYYSLPFSAAAWLTYILLAVGVGVLVGAVLQLNTHLTPWPSPAKNGRLISSGFFKYVRHPIYTGILLALAGWALRQQNAWQLCLCLFLWVLFYFKSRYEEMRLRKVYPGYKNYQQKTGRFLPRLF